MSIKNPTTTGWLRSRVKNWICCSLPSSKIRKSFWSRSETKRPFSSVTVTGTMTSLTCTLMDGGREAVCPSLAGAGAEGGGAGAWDLAGGACAARGKDRVMPIKSRRRIGNLALIIEDLAPGDAVVLD